MDGWMNEDEKLKSCVRNCLEVKGEKICPPPYERPQPYFYDNVNVTIELHCIDQWSAHFG
jgi:hypothetical protein